MSTQKAPIWAAVDKLSERLNVLEIKLNTLAVPVVPTPVESVFTPTPPINDTFPKYPIPPDFITVVDEVLNKDFGIECDPLPDTPAFNFKIVVPEKYSNTPKEKRNGADVRSKVITYSEGAVCVRLWCDKVLDNLGADTKFRITEDRPFANRPI